MGQMEPFHQIWTAIEANFVLKVTLEAVLADMVLVQAARLLRFTTLDRSQRAGLQPATQAGWHLIHLANIAFLGVLWVLLTIGLLAFARSGLSIAVFLFLVVFSLPYVALRIEDYVVRR